MKRAARRAQPFSQDTVLMEDSEQTEVSVFATTCAPNGDQPGGNELPLPSQKKKKKPVPRDVVDEDHLCTLVSAYNVHFEEYSKGKTNVTQLIPSLVWKATYASYLHVYPASVFKQESLKDKLRDSLKELATGNSNELNAEKVAVQCNIVMSRLKCTDGHAKRNVLRARQKIVETVNLGSDSDGSESDPIEVPSPISNTPVMSNQTPATPQYQQKSSKGSMKENHPVTKAQMLQRQTTSIERLCTYYQQSTAKREALVEFKLQGNNEKHKRHRLANLKAAHEMGVIDDVELKVCVKELLFAEDLLPPKPL